MNISVIDRETMFGQDARKVLIVSKDFTAGEVIYKACGLFQFKKLLLMSFFPIGVPYCRCSRS